MSRITPPSGHKIDELTGASVVSGNGWRSLAITWVTHQGASTVLLILLLIGMYNLAPTALENIRIGYENNAKQLQTASDNIQKTMERVIAHDRSMLQYVLVTSEYRAILARNRALLPPEDQTRIKELSDALSEENMPP